MFQQVEAETLQPSAPSRPGSHLPVNHTTYLSNLSATSLRPLILDFSNNSVLNIGKDLNVMKGATVYAVSSNPQIQNVILRANNIFNYGTITSVLPNGGLPGYENAIANLSLSLIATQRFVNKGTISSAGSLSIFSGASFSNSGPQSIVQANGVLNILSPNIVNGGQIQSINSNINLNLPSTLSATIANLLPSNWQNTLGNNFQISSTNGSFTSQNGVINIGELGASKQNFDIAGGSFLSRELNINGGKVLLNVGNVSGVLNSNANELHEFTKSNNLQLGNICTTGDPTFYNTGDIQLTGDISVGENLAIISGGNITSTSALKSITTQDAQGQGHEIYLIAGAKITPGCGECSSNAAPGSNASYGITVDLKNGTGGNIDLSQSSGLQIDASSTGTDLNGANITLAATMNTTSATKGVVTLPTNSLLNSSGNGNGLNGNVTVLGGGGVTIGAIESLGGSGRAMNNGTVTVTTSTPISSDSSNQISFDASGKASTTIVPGNSLNYGPLNMGSVNSSTINFSSSIINLNGNLNTSNGGFNGDGGSISFNGSVFVKPGANGIHADAVNNGNGGKIIASNIGSVDSSVSLQVSANGSGTGNGGTISLTDSNSNNFIGTGTGKIGISATGGSPGSMKGNGGIVSLFEFSDINTAGLNTSPLGLSGNGARLVLASQNSKSTLSGSLSANGLGDGNGGTIGLHIPTIDTSDSNGVGSISADSGASGANAGTISFYLVDSISLKTGYISASSANGNGGTINITTDKLLNSSVAIPLIANGGGTGNGGNVNITGNSGSTVTIGNTPGAFLISASGGSPGSLAGAGGNVFVDVSNISIDANYCNAAPLGVNGNGATYLFKTTGSFTYSGVPLYNGVGSGKNGYAINSPSSQLSLNFGLDLSDKASVSKLQSLQSSFPYYFSGQLEIQDGIATGGELFISNGVNLQGLKGLYIPSGVTLSLFSGQTVSIASGKSQVDGRVTFKAPIPRSFTTFLNVETPDSLVVNGTVDTPSELAINAPAININGAVNALYVYVDSRNVSLSGTIYAKNHVEFVNSVTVQQASGSIIETPILTFQSASILPTPPEANFAGQNRIAALDFTANIFSLNNTIPLTLKGSYAQTSSEITNSEKVTLSTPVPFGPKTSISSPIFEIGSTLTYGKQQATLSGASGSTIQSTAPLIFDNDGISSTGNITFSGNFVSSSTSISSQGTIKTEFGTQFKVNDNLVINTVNLINPNAFIAKSIVLNVSNTPNGNTIMNPFGDLVIDKNTVVNAHGANLALLAQGNIIANGASIIDLSSKTANGGNLTAVAGINLSGDLPRSPNGQSSDPFSILILQGASTTGGSISLGKTAINTSAQGGNSGGEVIMIANKGSINPGTIITGAIDSSAQSGKGGDIFLSGPSGILINGSISSKGQGGAGDVRLTTKSTDVTGTEIYGGAITNKVFAEGSSQAGAGIIVKGSIDASAAFASKKIAALSNGFGGSVQLDADALIEISGAVNATGRIGGDINLSSASRGVHITGDLNNSASAAIVTDDINCSNCGNAGNIVVSAPSFITIGGKILSVGAAATALSVRAGNGGAVSMQTEKIQATGLYSGLIHVARVIDISGGAGSSAVISGNAGSLNTQSGSIQFLGVSPTKFGNASIIASAGATQAGGKSGTDGSVVINTYSVQNIPSNLNLASKNSSEYALAGGTFAVGESPFVVNGSRSNIIIGSTVIGRTTNSSGVFAGNISYQKFDLSASGGGSLKITTAGTPLNYSFVSGNQIIPVSVSAGAAGHRTKVTPSQALALYEASLGNAQLFGLNPKGQVTATNLQHSGPSIIDLAAAGLPEKFTSFQVTAQDVPSAVQVNITGVAPVLNASSIQAKIYGQLNFPTAIDATIYSKSIFVGEGASIAALNQLNLLTPTLTNYGSISASHLFVLGDNAQTKVSNYQSGSLAVSDWTLGSFGAGYSISLNNKNVANPALAFVFSRATVPIEVSGLANKLDVQNNGGKASLSVSSYSPSFSISGSTSNFSSLGITSNKLSNKLPGADIIISANTQLVSSAALTIRGANVQIGDNSNLQSTAANLTVQSRQQLTIGSNAQLNASGGLELSGGSGIKFGDDNKLNLSNGKLLITAGGSGIKFGDDNKLNLSNGKLLITADGGNIDIGNRNTLTAGDTRLLARSGQMLIANSNSFTATNGNLVIMAQMNFAAGSQNTFSATQKSLNGPVIELGAGTTSNHIATAHFGKSSNLPIASSITYFPFPNYRVYCPTCPQTLSSINLSNNATHASVSLFDGGTLFLDSKGSANTLFIDGAQITGIKPIGFSTNTSVPQLKADSNSFESVDGDSFINPKADLVLENSLMNLHIKKNALVSISRSGAHIRVINCGSRGDVYFRTSNGRVVLEAGEELTISAKPIKHGDLLKADGIGRRGIKTFSIQDSTYAAVCDVSLVTVLSSAKHFEQIKNAKSAKEREILNRILKTASALQTITARRGNYLAIPRKTDDSDNAQQLTLGQSI